MPLEPSMGGPSATPADDNERPTFTTSTAMGGGVPDLGTPAQPQVQMQQPQTPDDAEYHHSAMLGKAAKMLLGQDSQYTTDANGNIISTPSQRAPGQFFRDVLAASLLGAAAGANGNSAQGFAGGFARGGAAEVGNAQQQDFLKRQQVEQDFKNQQVVREQNREDTNLATSETLRKAQIAHANAETYRTNVLTQGEDYTMHQKVADMGKQHFADYSAAGLEPVIKDVSESDMHDMLKTRPGASTFDWEPTGVKVGVGDNGQPTHEYTYSAYDPKGNVPVSQGTIDQWKKDGMEKFYPDLFNVVKAGKEISADQYIALKRKDTQLYNDNLVRQKNDQSNEKFQADLRKTNAETASHLATAAHERTSTGMLLTEKTKQQAISNAYNELNAAGGDFTKLSPKSQAIIGEAQAALIPGMNSEYATLVKEANDPMADPSDRNEKLTRAKSLLKQIDGIRSLSMQAIGFGTRTASTPPSTLAPHADQAARQPQPLPQGNGQKIDADTAIQFLQQAGGDKTKARALATQNGWKF